MAPNGTVFGGRKFRGGRDVAEEQAALMWIYAVLREPVPNAPFDELLKDGQVLCRFLQKIEPSLIRKFNTSGSPIKMMENLGIFTDGCRQLGVSHVDLFRSIDLWDKGDIGAVYNCLSQLGGTLQKIRPDIPAYGGRITEESKKNFADQSARYGDKNTINQQYNQQQQNQSYGHQQQMNHQRHNPQPQQQQQQFAQQKQQQFSQQNQQQFSQQKQQHFGPPNQQPYGPSGGARRSIDHGMGHQQ